MPRKKFDVEARVSVKDDASKNVKKVESGFKRLTKTIKSSALAQVAAIAGVAVAFRAVVRAIGASITAANKQAEAINALEGALAPLGSQVEKVSKALQEQAAALQKVTTFGDEEIIEAQALIASFVREEDQIKAATKATLDLAEAKGFSLVSAADLVSKTLGSSTNALTRYGIEVTGAVGSTERLSTLTENIATVFGGRAQKATETFSGKVKQLSNAWGDLAEDIGEAITNNEDASRSIDDLTKSVEEIAPSVAKFAVSMLKASTAVVRATSAVSEFIAKIVVGSADLLGFNKITDDTEVSMNALAGAAARQGISIEQLQRNLEATVGANRLLRDRTKETTEAMVVATEAAERQARAQAKLDAAAKESATAMEKLGTALGIVTSAQIETEIREIEQALEAARDKTGGLGEEFERLEEIATARIEALRAQVERLQDGLGNLSATAGEAGGNIGSLGTAAEEAGDSVGDLGDALDKTNESASGTGEVFQQLDGNVRAANRGLREQIEVLRITSGEYDRLRRTMGETVALQEALERGGRLTQGGTRVRFPGGGSRLVNTSGRGTSDYGLSPFGTGGRQTNNPNGTLRPL